MSEGTPDLSPSFFSRLDLFHKLVGLGAGIIAVWGTYVTIQTNRNADRISDFESRLSQIREERAWAKELYVNYDAIVSKEATEQARIDRLAGLLALTELTDEKWPTLRSQWATLIRQQAARYEASLAAKATAAPNTQQVQAQLSQYRQIQKAAAATAVRHGPVWSNYDFDIFYCPGEANRVAAQRIASLKGADPNATGNWQLRPISNPAAPVVSDKRPYSIVWDFEDELPLARLMAQQLREQRVPSAGDGFRVLQSNVQKTRWYLSIFVCPTQASG